MKIQLSIQQIADQICQENPDPVVRHIIIRRILDIAIDSEDSLNAQVELKKSRWVRSLENEQWNDGSWGRLHSKDTKSKQVIPTTEYAVQRAICIGLNHEHHVLQKASQYLIKILEKKIRCRDPEEQNDRWDTGVQLFAASTLSRIKFDPHILGGIWQLWFEIARCTFADGTYNSQAEIQAHRDLTGASVKNSYLRLNNKYTLVLLSSQPNQIPVELEKQLLKWLWYKGDGIGYLGEPLFNPPTVNKAGQLERWFTSLELLSRFPSWVAYSRDVIDWLWRMQNHNGLWDFGPKSVSSVMFPLSEDWRRKNSRQIDWTTRVLLLLVAYYSRL